MSTLPLTFSSFYVINERRAGSLFYLFTLRFVHYPITFVPLPEPRWTSHHTHQRLGQSTMTSAATIHSACNSWVSRTKVWSPMRPGHNHAAWEPLLGYCAASPVYLPLRWPKLFCSLVRTPKCFISLFWKPRISVVREFWRHALFSKTHNSINTNFNTTNQASYEKLRSSSLFSSMGLLRWLA
jgi:hypothetical protein